VEVIVESLLPALPGAVAPRPFQEAPMAQKALPDGYHFSISVSQSLWSDLLGEALPIEVGQGDFDLVDSGRKLLAAAEVQVKGLLTGVEEKLDEAPVLGNPVVKNARGRLRKLASKGREVATRRFEEAVSIRGRWRAKVAKDGSHFSYHDGGVTLDARAVFEADGRVLLFGDQFEIPFHVERAVDGTASLDEVQFDRNRRQLEGRLGRVSLSLGESLPMRLLKLAADRVIEQQVDKVNPIPLIPSQTLEGMILPGQGPLKLQAGIDDLHVGIGGQDLTLSVRFAFKGSQAA
jgi:hypothetical protein